MLNDTQIRNAKPKSVPYKLKDGNGLYLDVRPSGSRLWRYRYKIAGKENLYAVGEYPAMSLAEARVERDNARKLIKDGIHPAHHRRTEALRKSLAAESTFQAVAETWIKTNPHWSDNYRRQIQRRLSGDVFPRIGNLPIRSITPAHVKDGKYASVAQGRTMDRSRALHYRPIPRQPAQKPLLPHSPYSDSQGG